jgi:outer membrane biosynthesis protein TonB
MGPLLHHLAINVRLHLRNPMALVYSYIFPTIFLIAFWVLYRFEQVPLVRHMGELLTVTALGGACFGLPTSMVGERERGVWRRYRLTPVSTGTLVAGTAVARYLLLIVAGLLQVALAMGIGMPLPKHPIELLIAFTCVAFAFIGLGLVIAMMADNVPAVQALGQCLFLPMLIIGGVAVPLANLPEWAQRLSSFFPGRYAVEAIQACVTGDGLAASRFSVLALLLIGAAGCVAGAMMFRWDAQQRFFAAPGRGWVAVPLAAWMAVGISAETRGRRSVSRPPQVSADARATATATDPERASQPATATPDVSDEPAADPIAPPAAAPSPSPAPETPPRTPEPSATAKSEPKVDPKVDPKPDRKDEPTSAAESAAPEPAKPSPPSTALAKTPPRWQDVTMADIERDLIFTRLPPDEGVVTPIARFDEIPEPEIAEQLERMRIALPAWKPGQVADPVQRVRNLLYVAAVPDVFQMTDLEKFIPYVIYDYIQAEIPRDDLIKILYWIALHPFDGDDSAVDELRPLGLNNGPADMETTRDRLSVYAVKLLGRITGKIQQ